MFRSWYSPASILWVCGHLVVLLLGTTLLSNQSLHELIGKGVAEGIGGSLIATGISGVVLFLYVRSSDTLRDRLEVFAKAGVLSIFPVRSVRIRNEYDVRLDSAKTIDLVGYGLSSFRQDYAAHFASWSRNAQIRILVIDPDFPSAEVSLADQRDREEKRPVGDTRQQVLSFEDTIRNDPNLDKNRFQLRRMRSIPAINMLRIDNEIFWGPYLMNQQSRNTPTILVARGGYLYDALIDHFDALWDQAQVRAGLANLNSSMSGFSA